MVSHIAALNLSIPSSQLNAPFLPSPGRPVLKLHSPPKPKTFILAAAKFGILEPRGIGRRTSGLCCCAGELASEGDAELEAMISEFMEKSEKPKAFPTRKELEKSGRFDLVDAIRDRGGWFALGWDSGDEEQLDDESETVDIGFEIKKLRRRMTSSHETTGFYDESGSHPASSSGRLLETESEDGGGIEGILSRLEKERNSSLGINIGKYRNGDEDSRPDTWRIWSIQRAGCQNAEFEAGEIAFNQDREGERRVSTDGIDPPAENATNDLHRQNGNDHHNIRTRLQHLEVELASALQLLRSKSEEHASREVTESSLGELQRLSDALEFQENELMNDQERLRSLRAKLAVVEGKMALAIIDAQKMVEAKQKRIDDAHKALQLLRDVHIVWPSAASQVFVTGSFDGWTTQRKMEKSSTCIFSVCLKLYPGRYEIKFVVDGEWRVDPLRPIVHNNGYENNLLIVT